MKYLLLLIPLFVIGFGFSQSFSAPPPPPTTFEISLIDESNKEIVAPALLLVTETLDGEEIQSYTLDLRTNPQENSFAWYMPNKEANTEIHLVAAKLGYEKSDEFVFTITEQTPKEGILFEHTFKLSLKESSKITDTSHQIDALGNTFTINTKSTSNIQQVEFNEEESTLSVILSGDALRGTTDLKIPTSLMKPPFSVSIDNVIVAPKQDETSKETILYLGYTNGQHDVRITFTPEVDISDKQLVDDDDQLQICEEGESLKDGKCVPDSTDIPIEIIIGAIAAIAAAAVAVFFLMRKKDSRYVEKFATTPTKRRSKFCRKCGTATGSKNKFCRKCGIPITYVTA